MITKPATRCDATQQNLKLVDAPMDLAIQKRRALQLLLGGKAVAQVAEAIGVDRTTVYRWLKEPGFIAERNRQATDLWEAGQARLRSLVGKSLDVVERQVEAGNLKAALAILKLTRAAGMEKPDNETNEHQIIKKQAESMAMKFWFSQPFSEQTNGSRPFSNSYFMEVVNMIHEELHHQFAPEPSDAEDLIAVAADRQFASSAISGNRRKKERRGN
jgi:transposase-like protein